MSWHTSHSESDHEAAVGWISTAELFLLVGALLLGMALLFQARAGEERRKNASMLEGYASVQKQLEERNSQLADAQKKLDEYIRQLADAQKQPKERDSQLAVAQKELEEYAKQLADAQKQLHGYVKQLTDAQKLLKKRDSQLADAQKKLVVYVRQLADAQKKLEEYAKQLADVQKLLEKRDSQLADAQTLLNERDSQLADSAKQIVLMKNKIEAYEVDRRVRFEGIDLGSKNVVFLVDMSGSMKLIRRETQAPKKWPEVVATLKRLMRSMPNLERYQVIAFSDRVIFPLHHDNEWINKGPSMAEETEKAVAAIDPVGGTNLYAALERAFKYRSSEPPLDAIYLLSDGLPNKGSGVEPDRLSKLVIVHGSKEPVFQRKTATIICHSTRFSHQTASLMLKNQHFDP